MSVRTEADGSVLGGMTLPAPTRSWTFMPVYGKDGDLRAITMLDTDDYYGWMSEKRWYLGRDGYLYRNLSHKTEGKGHVALHREVLGLSKGDGVEGDHINRDRFDNRRMNLRATNSSGNKQNAGLRSDNLSGYRGVKYHKACKSRPWQARCWVGGRERSFGYYTTPEEAAEAARAARERHMPYATD